MQIILKAIYHALNCAWWIYLLIVCFLHILLEKSIIDILLYKYLWIIPGVLFILFLIGFIFEQKDELN